MRFSEKLDFLMNITKTTNSALARYTALDASHVSRLRRGERRLPKSESYIRALAAYFARSCLKDYQKKALTDVLDEPDMFDLNAEKVAELLHRWLLDDKSSEGVTLGRFLNGLSHFQFKTSPAQKENCSLTELPADVAKVSIHYGPEGKREAVLAFLSSVLNSQKQHGLLLYSDEEIAWLTDDPLFAAKWADLLTQVIMRGNRVKIIHTVSRNLDEMLKALAKWMPLYMTGAIEPYYYPKKRDGIFQRTLFVAPKTAAVISTSIGTMAAKAANFLLREPEAVDAVTEEFNSYLSLCRPLMRIFHPRDGLEYLRALSAFEGERADGILKSEPLSLVTMPLEIAESMIARTKNSQKEEIIKYFRTRQRIFKDSLQNHCLTEVINLSSIASFREGKVRIGASGMLDGEDVYYTVDELRLHLENIVAIMQNYENYHVCIENDIDKGYLLYVKEDLGAIMLKTSAPFIMFAINESNLTAALWDFMKDKIGDFRLNKGRVILALQSVIGDLKEH